ncbi:MAG TPA: TonB-dependent receptor [Vicinamibacteria bacterium]|nr:TonB-dependent receptor [Vicinamibacteria bacterium]
MRKLCRACIVSSLSAWPLAVAALAQNETGRIEGRVLRTDLSPVSGVSVVLNELSLTDITDANGLYGFPSVPAGTYSVSFILGANLITESGVVVTAGQTTHLEPTVDWEVGFAETLTVYGASRRVERIVEAPAAVTVVDEKEIEQVASHGQAPKLLEYTPGAEVTQSGVYDFNFNTRGFNSSLNRRVATLVDGRDPSVPFLGAQEWAAISFPLDDLATVELVRGPSAALYGANASSGVLNMTSKQPRYSQGGLFRVTGGELDTVNLDFRLAQSLTNDWYIKLVGGLRNSGDFTVSRRGFAEYSVPCTTAGQTDCLPQEAVPLARENDDDIYFGGVRLDKYLSNGMALTFEGGYADVAGPVFQTGIGRVQLVDVQRPWARFNWNAERFNFFTYYSGRKADQQLALSSGTNLALDSYNVHLEGQTNWSLAAERVRLVVGGSYRHTDIDSLDPNTGRQSLMFEPVSSDQGAIFGQVDWNINERWKAVVAGRFDESTLHDPQFSPKASLVYNLNRDSSLRFTYNEAFQVANYSEFFLEANVAAPLNLAGIEAAVCTPFGVNCGFGTPTRIVAVGNNDLEVEKTKMFEIGYSGIIANRAFITLDYYNARNDRFITDLIPQLDAQGNRTNPDFGPYQPPANHPAPALLVGALRANLPPQLFAILSNNFDGTPFFVARSYTNFGRVNTQGIDFGLNYYFLPDWTFSFAYSWFDFEIQDQDSPFANQLLPNTPGNKIAAGIGYTTSRWDAAFDLRRVDEFRWSVGPFQGDVEAYTTADLRGNYHFNEHFGIGLNVSNLFDSEHWQSFGGDLLGRRALVNALIRWQ